MEFGGQITYGICFLIFGLGLYITLTSSVLVKKLFGLSILQTAVMLFFIAVGYINNSKPPIIKEGTATIYANPLPQVLILTAIVVGLATLAVGLALCIRIRKKFGVATEDVTGADIKEGPDA